MDRQYNGWTNKPTWTVYTWLSNSIETYRIVQDRSAQELCRLVHDMYEHVLENAGIASDLLRWTLAHVDWRELERAFAEEKE